MVDGTAAKQVSVCCYRPAAAPAESFQAAVGPVGLLGRHECCRRRHHSKLGLRTGPGDTPLRPAAGGDGGDGLLLSRRTWAGTCRTHARSSYHVYFLHPQFMRVRHHQPVSVVVCSRRLQELKQVSSGNPVCLRWNVTCGPALHWLSMIQQRPKTCQRPNGSDASPETRIFSEKAWCQEAVGWIHSHHKLYLSKVVYRLRVVHLYIRMGIINVSQAYAVESEQTPG